MAHLPSESLKKPVRKLMQQLIGIANNDMIINISKPVRSAMDNFGEGNGPPPFLCLMRFCFNVLFQHPWNKELVDKFINKFAYENSVAEDECYE